MPRSFYILMGSHRIRQEKWEDIEHNVERSTELLGDVQELIEELMEDYSYTSYAEERRDISGRNAR